jgi:hypothetical protein
MDVLGRLSTVQLMVDALGQDWVEPLCFCFAVI